MCLWTRLWRDAQPIVVQVDAFNAPQQFRWQGYSHQVDNITQHWLIDTDWWEGRVWRAYFKLVTDSGALLEIYQDLLTGDWFVETLYD